MTACDQGWPDPHDFIVELREAVGLFAGVMPIPPKVAWDEAVAVAKRAVRERDEYEAERDGAVAYVREALERLALTAEVPIEDEHGPRANFYLVDDIEAELTRRYKALTEGSA